MRASTDTSFFSFRRPRRWTSLIGALFLICGVIVVTPPGGDTAFAQTGPELWGSPTGDWIELRGWPAGASVNVTVGEDSVPASPITVNDDGWAFFDAGQDLLPGLVVEATDGSTTKSLSLFDFSIDNFVPEGPVVSGTAPQGTTLFVQIGNDFGGCDLEVVADEGGWTADFSAAGCPDFSGGGELSASAVYFDIDGDGTSVSFVPPQPDPVPGIQVSVTNDWIHLYQWPAGASVTVKVGEDSVPASPITVNEDGWASFDAGQDLLPGLVVEATDGSTTKSVTVLDIAITEFNLETNTIRGTSETVVISLGFGGAEWCGLDLDVIDGLWSYVTTDPPCEIVLVEGMNAFAELPDGDGDSSGAEPIFDEPGPGGNTQIQANVTEDALALHGWTDGFPVTIRIFEADGTPLCVPPYQPVGGECVDVFGNPIPPLQWPFEGGSINLGPDDLGLPDGRGLEPGMTIEVTDGGNLGTRELIVEQALFKSYGYDSTFLLSGESPVLPIDEVRFHLFDHDNNGITQDGGPIPFLPPSGTWAYDLGGFGYPVPLLSAIFEIPDEQQDGTNDGTFATLPVVSASAQEGRIFSDHFDDDACAPVFLGDEWVPGDPCGVEVAVYDGDGLALLDEMVDVGTRGDFSVGFGLEPGMRVEVTGQRTGIHKTLFVDPIGVDGFDIDGGAIWGHASPFATIRIDVGNDEGGRELVTHADEFGGWQAEFGDEEFALAFGMGGSARAIDEDTDQTVAGFALEEPAGLALEQAQFNIAYGQSPDGAQEWYAAEALIEASGNWGDEGPTPEDVHIWIDNVEFGVESIELWDNSNGLYRFAASAPYSEGDVKGIYEVAVSDDTGMTERFLVGYLGDVPEGLPTMTEGPGLSDGTPDFAWDPFYSEYQGDLYDPWVYELNFGAFEENWVFPIEPHVTSIAFEDPAWQPEPLEPLDPGVYFGTLHSNHDVVPGSFTFEHHRQFVVVVIGGGFVTGGGWFQSPPGTFFTDPDAAGPVYFGLNVKYKNGSDVPTGNLEMQLQPAGLNFRSTGFDWMYAIETSACFAGSGTMNGAGDYGFFMCVEDADADMVYVRFEDRDSGETVYENEGIPLGGGNIVVHHK